MLKQFSQKLKEALVAVLPIVVLILAVGITPVPLFSLTKSEAWAFVFGSAMAILGIALFNLGAEMSMTPMGKYVGGGLTKRKKLFLLLAVSFVVGVLVTVSEPDLSVLAQQLSAVLPSKLLLVLVVGAGVGAFLVVAILKIVFKKSLSTLLMFFYLLLFALAVLVARAKGQFLPLAFDSGGVTTGPVTVPFIMALGIGIAQTLSGKDAKENSFGLIALCSCGAVVAVLLLSIFAFNSQELAFDVSQYTLNSNIVAKFFSEFFGTHLKEVALSLGLIVAVFVVCQLTFLKLPLSKLLRLAVGIVVTLLGLTMFLTAANTVFLGIGYKVGVGLASANPLWGVVFTVALGALVVLAEPAILVLVNQVEEITVGGVSRRSMLTALAVGVGLALGISALRIVLQIPLMYIIVPGYIVSLALSLFVPPVYTAIAFDSGGVASGPLTSCFILPLMVGLCAETCGTSAIFEYAFGVVALVAMVPLITIQMLGFGAIIRKNRARKIAMKAMLNESDEQIIDF